MVVVVVVEEEEEVVEVAVPVAVPVAAVLVPRSPGGVSQCSPCKRSNLMCKYRVLLFTFHAGRKKAIFLP